MTVSAWIDDATRRLKAVGIDEARLEAQVIAARALSRDRTWIIAHPHAEFPEVAGEVLILRRLRREPLAYITQRREFYGREFVVRPSVLIPRQETETLIEAALELPNEPTDVLDIGTGSGCIAITLSKERSRWNISGVDISPTALEVAKENAAKLGARVSFYQSDIANHLMHQSFDLIVSNPPYVSEQDDLAPEIRKYEPDIALFASGDGLDFYRRLCTEAREILRPGGHLMMEMGIGQAEKVKEIFGSRDWRFHKIWKDLQGIARVIVFQKA